MLKGRPVTQTHRSVQHAERAASDRHRSVQHAERAAGDRHTGQYNMLKGRPLTKDITDIGVCRQVLPVDR